MLVLVVHMHVKDMLTALLKMAACAAEAVRVAFAVDLETVLVGLMPTVPATQSQTDSAKV